MVSPPVSTMSDTEEKRHNTRETLDGDITLSEALQEEDNMLEKLALDDYATDFVNYFACNHKLVTDIIVRHMNLTSSSEVFLAEWVWGSFNACVPVYIRGEPSLFIRFPLPFKVGERHFPGNCDEKVKCEAGTYAWISENCPDVPIPKLFGYGLSDGRSFTVLENIPLITRLFHITRRHILRWAGYTVPCRYVANGRSELASPYLLIENVENDSSMMLSKSWSEERHNSEKRQNLFRDLSRIMLSLGRVPQPRIGSFTIDSKGCLSLTNRPLLMQLNQLENEGIDTGIARSDVYRNTVPFALDLVHFHDNYIRQQPNAVNDKEDGEQQMATFACMRTVLPLFFSKPLRDGPFALTLTDMHQSNLFVDEDWHIRAVIDLEYAIALPIEMQLTPTWLSSQNLDGLANDTTEFDQVHKEFIDVYRDEECARSPFASPRADLMNRAWQTKAFFFYHALRLRTGSVNTFAKFIRPLFTKETDTGYDISFATFWATDSGQTLACKLQDMVSYQMNLQRQFLRGPS